ncbi:hypothetical protein DB346_23570 [Verrucomicrobia bacterium LW23]|nr:hypothetical protein DB346_23570 [Verrucomicrobia bacterium LW23]
MSKVYQAPSGDPEMNQAFERARETFRFFWREVYWERRRIIPALGMTAVKLPFIDEADADEEDPTTEHMWVTDVEFDGETLSGTLLNDPNNLEDYSEGDEVCGDMENISDWIYTADDRAFGAYTVNLLRSRMSPRSMAEHDKMWGLDFGDPADIRVELSEVIAPLPIEKPGGGLFAGLGSWLKKKEPAVVPPASVTAPAGFRDHPMCINSIDKIKEMIHTHRDDCLAPDESGLTTLHREALAGNLAIVRLLLEVGADRAAKTPAGHTPADLARIIGWKEIAAELG